MSKIKSLIEKLHNEAEDEVYWLGSCDESQIKILENKLKLSLPAELKEFILLVGGGGIVEEEISGIVNNDALTESEGSIYYDTCQCRNEYTLPMNLAVIYFKDDEVCWCVDCRKDTFGQIINYDLFSKKILNVLAPSFESFFEEYVNLRT
ncbi:SMI1/KNR4 family protein [Gilliamella sp. B3464]|uniref:SMI1/KNR4 family protein n=1 Tax=unclassified Gilliamella TaxID=2685620 RepID=UPI002269F3E7|nr:MULTISPECIES: SMI1/KNR4 family protein [unclassified Gilliamella]MCX8712186.1 SMI1/KNR4 family protein [Gilliamella sp. B3468]MCX8751269.1 SMI1/KNR4 family protein [Gilliamella sp. B3464]